MMWRWVGECIHMPTMPSAAEVTGAPGDVLAHERAVEVAVDAVLKASLGELCSK